MISHNPLLTTKMGNLAEYRALDREDVNEVIIQEIVAIFSRESELGI